MPSPLLVCLGAQTFQFEMKQDAVVDAGSHHSNLRLSVNFAIELEGARIGWR
jgi:hypothetical protein